MRVNLSEFLLDRIAEDQAAAERVELCPYAGGDPGNGAMHVSSARVLAECEAKRRIVELRSADDMPSPNSDYTRGWLTLGYFVCQSLAQPYADHPEFDPEWRL